MKKLLDNKFLFIVALSLIVLISLGFGAFYLFDDSDDVFVKSGYVINPLSAKVEKYFFNEDSSYKENLSSMVVFKDVDDKDVSILKDSFLHYNDGSLSFLKNGAILDLNTIGEGEAVNFYNITSKSIIEKNNSGYVIKNSGSDIKLKNFIGRINDDKYIVVGSLNAKIPGNEKNISGDYFEIVYTEKGIVNIENKNVKFQVTAEGTLIYAGNVVIDLGDKKITKNGEDIMSITAITIDGDENIEIIPAAPKEDENNNDENNNGNGNGTGENGNGNGGTGKDNIEVEIKEDIIVSLKDAKIGSTSIDVTFDMVNQKDEDSFTLKVTNLDSGRTVDMVNAITANDEMRIDLLSPNTKYLFTVINEKDESKYFQKIFETNDFGIKLEKTYATDGELGFKVIVDKDTDITNAKLSLWKYNEETNKNEIVTTSYYDSETEETKYVEKVTELSSIEGNIEGVHEVVYDGLDSNTIYTAVLDEFSLASTNFKDTYNITMTTMTLKKAPEFNNMSAIKNVAEGSFKLSLNDIVDEDNAIESYTYKIYSIDDPDKTVIEPISKNNASPIEIKIGDGENELSNGVNYFYKVIIEYFDNEKYIEYTLNDSINFSMENDPYITVIPNNDKITFDKIGATIYLTDNSCLIAMPEREKCEGESTARVIVSTITSTGISYVYNHIVNFTVSDDDIKYELEVGGLQAGTTYFINVESVINGKEEDGTVQLLHTDESAKSITTKTLTNFVTDWTDAGSSSNHVINLKTKFIADGNGTLAPEESAASIQKVVLKLYNGGYTANIGNEEPIAVKSLINTENFSIKEKFYDNSYSLTSEDTFGLDINALKALNDDKLSEYYTLAIYAYYDERGTNEVKLTNNITSYKISPLLLVENMRDPKAEAKPLTKAVSGINNYLNNNGTIVGYHVINSFDYSGLVENDMIPVGINLYVYNEKFEKVKFYVKNGDELVLIDGDHYYDTLDENISGYYSYENDIFMDYGSDYYNTDSVMSRGNNYYIGFAVVVENRGSELLYPNNTNSTLNTVSYGKFVDGIVKTQKESPLVTMYIAKSTVNSITYRYVVKDPDNALYKEKNADDYGYYYVINDGEERKLNLELDSSNTKYNSYVGDITINGLTSGDTYSLYYKKNISKTGKIADDVKPFFDEKDDGNRLFEGFYDSKDSKYNFSYEVKNTALDNKVSIKINATKDILDRIVNYKVTFSDGKHESIVKNLWKLSKCDGDGEEEIARCLSVNYIDLKSMKSENNVVNTITVDVVAYYDNGLSGYDYTIGEDKDFQYMILQNNLVPDKNANYVTFSKNGSNVAAWNEEDDVSKGYYTYTKGNRSISYTSVLFNNTVPIPIDLKSIGYDSTYGVLNPKMISYDNMSSNKKTFSFNSITPKINVGKTTRMINGAVVSLALENADLVDFCEDGHEGQTCINNSSSDFYLYIDTWLNDNYVGDRTSLVRPTVKVKINKENPNSSINAVIDNLYHASTYYYSVYAYLNKNGKSQYTQLFDSSFTDKYQTKVYSFSSLLPSELFHSFESTYKVNSDGEYGDKNISTKINLIAYENNVLFNFDLAYAFCDYDKQPTCGIDEGETNIFKSLISRDKLKTSISDVVGINEYDIEFNKKYVNFIYAIYQHYDTDMNIVTAKVKINRDDLINLRKLATPEFVVERAADYINGEYLFNFNINVKDNDRLLNNGEYFVVLLDEDNNVVGNLQVKDEDGNYVTVRSNGEYEDYAFDALVANNGIRITGLERDKKYTFEVFNKAYINNYDPEVPKDKRTITVSKKHTVYSVNEAEVAFGRDLIFSATKKTFVVTFLGGSKFDNVKEVGYTVGLFDADNNTVNSTYGGLYIIGENNKKFELFRDTGDWKFTIDDDRIDNILGQTYTVGLSFKVVKKDKVTGQDIEYYYDSISNPEFAGKAQYVKDE